METVANFMLAHIWHYPNSKNSDKRIRGHLRIRIIKLWHRYFNVTYINHTYIEAKLDVISSFLYSSHIHETITSYCNTEEERSFFQYSLVFVKHISVCKYALSGDHVAGSYFFFLSFTVFIFLTFLIEKIFYLLQLRDFILYTKY